MMAVRIYFAAGADHWPLYRAPLAQALAEAGVDAAVSDRCDDPAEVDYIIYAPGSALQDFTPFTRCKAVLNLWAGVERIVGNPTLSQPLCRMVDPALTCGMVEYVVGHTLRFHLGMDRDVRKPAPHWDQIIPPLAYERPVAMLGMGALGTACARALTGLGFPVTGWSRSAKDVPGITCLHGEAGLETVLRGASVVVTLLPKTPQTENLLDARRLAWLPRGAAIINPGRGPLIDDDALLAALDRDHVAQAVLDVFRVEPLPADHPFWAHPRVIVTPHVAADTRPASAARVVAENVRRGEAGEAFLHRVDMARGY